MDIRSEIRKLGSPERAEASQRFFKTGKGEYGEGDVFFGLSVPECRTIAKKFKGLELEELKPSILSEVHEERLIGLLVLVEKFKSASESERKKIYEFYLSNRAGVNNWDLVDLTAHKIVGGFLYGKDESEKKILYEYARSENLWERRIAVLATFWFISKNEFDDSLRIAEMLLKDKHDLIHKAVGWMLREIGKRDMKVEEDFLIKHYREMPRTMLRYAIERFPEDLRLGYLKGKI